MHVPAAITHARVFSRTARRRPNTAPMQAVAGVIEDARKSFKWPHAHANTLAYTNRLEFSTICNVVRFIAAHQATVYFGLPQRQNITCVYAVTKEVNSDFRLKDAGAGVVFCICSSEHLEDGVVESGVFMLFWSSLGCVTIVPTGRRVKLGTSTLHR